HKALDLIYDKLSHKIETLSENSITFQNEIMLKNISFSYNDKSIIDNLDLKIKKNEKIAFIGPSGSGKSTLVDIIIGLYLPTSGQLLVDG
ncbi:ATP-binding cassette domain-containing protein, partial [Aliarcobacter butzleri]